MAKAPRAKKSGRKKKGAPRRRSSTRRSATRRHVIKARRGGRKWSRRVTERSDALDLEQGVFKKKDPKKIAASLKRSVERSQRRKAEPYRSALSMLTFYINRGGKNLSPRQKGILNRAKSELRKQFGRD